MILISHNECSEHEVRCVCNSLKGNLREEKVWHTCVCVLPKATLFCVYMCVLVLYIICIHVCIHKDIKRGTLQSQEEYLSEGNLEDWVTQEYLGTKYVFLSKSID